MMVVSRISSLLGLVVSRDTIMIIKSALLVKVIAALEKIEKHISALCSRVKSLDWKKGESLRDQITTH